MALTDQSRWKYVLTAPDGAIPNGAGEVVQTAQRTFSDQLDGMRSASFAVTTDHPKLSWLMDNDALLKVYRLNRLNNWKLMMVGDVVQTEEKAQSNVGTVTVTAADPVWRLNKRLLGMAVDANKRGTGFTIGAPTAQIDLSVAIEQAVQQVNADFFSGVNIGTVANCGTTGVVGPLYSVFCAPTMQQICALLGGPDFWIAPQEPSGAMPNTVLGQINIQANRGSFKNNAIFEYGMGRHNVSAYDRLLTKQNMANHVVALPQGWPTSVAAGDQMAVYDDTTSQNTKSRFDDIASTDVANYYLRYLLCQQEVQVRAQRQQQITFQPTVDNPIDYTVDYDVGDVVIARAYDRASRTFRYNGSVRLYGVSVTIDDQDAETMALTLIPDQMSANNQISGAVGA